MTWFLMGIFIQNQVFYFRILETHNTHMDCLFAAELMVKRVGQPLKDYNVVCIGTDQFKQMTW